MASGAEFLQVIAALEQLTRFTIRSYEKCKKAIKSFRHAYEHMRLFSDDLSTVSHVLQAFTRIVKEVSHLNLTILGDQSLVGLMQQAVTNFGRAKRSIRTTCKKIETLMDHIVSGTWASEKWARIKWALSEKGEVKGLILRLQPIKHDISLFTGLLTLGITLKEVERLLSTCTSHSESCDCVPVHLLDKIKSIEKENAQLREERREAVQRYQDLLEEQVFSPSAAKVQIEQEMGSLCAELDEISSNAKELREEILPDLDIGTSSAGSGGSSRRKRSKAHHRSRRVRRGSSRQQSDVAVVVPPSTSDRRSSDIETAPLSIIRSSEPSSIHCSNPSIYSVFSASQAQRIANHEELAPASSRTSNYSESEYELEIVVGSELQRHNVESGSMVVVVPEAQQLQEMPIIKDDGQGITELWGLRPCRLGMPESERDEGSEAEQ